MAAVFAASDTQSITCVDPILLLYNQGDGGTATATCTLSDDGNSANWEPSDLSGISCGKFDLWFNWSVLARMGPEGTRLKQLLVPS